VLAFFLAADEIQNFGTDSFTEIAAEARKMKLGMTGGSPIPDDLIEEAGLLFSEAAYAAANQGQLEAALNLIMEGKGRRPYRDQSGW